MCLFYIMHTNRFYGTRLFILLFIAAAIQPARAQTDTALYQTLKRQDSLLFNEGFNHCNLAVFEQLVSNDFEFYHDQAGVIASREAFIASVQKNVCGQSYKARRVLDIPSLAVYPLKKKGRLYGAVQTGIHRFYALEPGKPEYFTSRAKFTHLWRLERGAWKLVRGLSYDHRDTDTTTLPDLGDAAAMNAWIRAQKVPALGIGLIREGQLQELHMYGELKTGKPATYNSLFNVASITKTITAYLVLKLVSAGKWQLDEPLYHYWTDPDVRADPRSRKLTTRHILNQRSGFPNWRRELPGRKLGFLFDPGSAYRYSGEGFEYLRRALEHKFRQSLDQLAATWVFQPLGMNDTHYTWTKELDEARFAVPHDAQGQALPIDKNTRPNAADLVTTSIPDLGKFLMAILRGEGLSAEMAAAMVHPDVLTKPNRYIGLCWFIYDQLGNGEYALSHGGDDPGAHTICFLLPKSKRGIIIFTNSDNGVKLYAPILEACLKEQGRAIVDIEMK